MHRNEFEARLVAKAWQDPQFCEQLKKDPKAVVASELAALKGGSDITLPDNLKVTLLEETPDQMYLVLPMNPRDTHAGLTGPQLQAVAGVSGAPPAQGADAPPTIVVMGPPAQTVILGPTLDIVQVIQVVGPVVTVIAGTPAVS